MSWELIQKENILQSRSSLPIVREVGVYVGIQQMEYGGMSAPYLMSIGPFSATGGPFSVAAGRMSFTYGFNGPSVSISSCQLYRLNGIYCPTYADWPLSSELGLLPKDRDNDHMSEWRELPDFKHNNNISAYIAHGWIYL